MIPNQNFMTLKYELVYLYLHTYIHNYMHNNLCKPCFLSLQLFSNQPNYLQLFQINHLFYKSALLEILISWEIFVFRNLLPSHQWWMSCIQFQLYRPISEIRHSSRVIKARHLFISTASKWGTLEKFGLKSHLVKSDYEKLQILFKET